MGIIDDFGGPRCQVELGVDFRQIGAEAHLELLIGQETRDEWVLFVRTEHRDDGILRRQLLLLHCRDLNHEQHEHRVEDDRQEDHQEERPAVAQRLP